MDRTDGQFGANHSILVQFDFMVPANCTVAGIRAILRRFVLTILTNGQLEVNRSILKRFKIPDIRTISGEPFNYKRFDFFY